MLLRERTRPGLGIIEPCLPSPAKAPPSGPRWIHEIKHDGFRILARRGPAGVRLITRNGNDFTSRFPFIEMAVKSLPVRSCLIDGEAIVCDKDGLAVFELIRGHLNEHFDEDGEIVFREACKLGCEGIVSKRLGSPYRSGRSAHWIKVKIQTRQRSHARPRRMGKITLTPPNG
jgi:ATP-dependent DNA ligase